MSDTPSQVGSAEGSQVESSEGQVDESSESSEGQEGLNLSQGQDAAKEVLNDPNASKKEKEAAKKYIKSLKIKVYGREIEEELPFEIPDDESSKAYMTKQLQMSRLAQIKAQEKSDIEREARQLIEMLRTNPRKVLSDPSIGVDIKKLAAEIIEEEIENSQKSPEQLRAEQFERELKELKEQRDKEQEEYKTQEFQRLQEQEFERYDMLITQALEKSDLPKSPYVVKKMADYMLMGLQQGHDITPSDVLPLVRDEIMEDLKSMFAVMPEDVIEGLVGKETINKIRKKNIAKAKGAGKPPVPLKASVKDVGQKAEVKKDATKKMTFKDFFGT